jgi:oxygen-independent coproporphyrinogen-3 oxidase
MAGIYIHIPFCKQACHYCDFHFSTNPEMKSQMIKLFAREIELQKNYLNKETVDTIYLGGGTPSLLNGEEIEVILSAIRQFHSVNPQAEVTLEGNPDDLTKEKLEEFYFSGINRLSIGIQSFDDAILKFFNRAHNSAEAMNCVEMARAAGFQNISLDLIYAVPGQDHDQWLANIEKALQLSPEHISSYSLTIEDKTAFGKWAKTGKLKVVDEEFAAKEFELLMNRLKKAGYDHYEISNFSKPDFYSRHNSNYWKQKKYLGIGPSAHSYNGESRQYNISNNSLYEKALRENRIPCEVELLSKEDKINEYVFTTLRTSWGCHLSYLKTHLNYDLLQDRSSYLQVLISQQLIDLTGDVLTLTNQGKFVADQIASDLFITT